VGENFAFLDLRRDEGKNAQSPLDQDISAPDATVRILVIHSQEDWMIARECWNLLQTATTPMGPDMTLSVAVATERANAGRPPAGQRETRLATNHLKVRFAIAAACVITDLSPRLRGNDRGNNRRTRS